MAQIGEKINRQNLMLNLLLCAVFLTVSIVPLHSYYKTKSPSQLLIDIEVSQSDKFQVFYDVGNGFNEKDSESIFVEQNDATQTLRFVLPPNVRNLRVDFGTAANTVWVDHIVWKNFTKKYIWGSEGIVEDFSIKNDIDHLDLDNERLKIVSNGKDPYLGIKNTQKISGSLSNDSLRIVFMELILIIVAAIIFFSLKLSNANIINGLKYIAINYRAIIISTCFIAIISVPMVSTSLGITSVKSDTEKRNLAVKPNINLKDKSFKSFISGYEKYVEDNFGFRQELIRFNNIVKVKLFNTSPSDRVIIGDEDWLFYNAEDEIEDYRGTNHFSNEELEKIKNNLEERSQWLNKKGVNFYFVVAPNKSTIYPEYLPSNIIKYNSESRLDQLINYLSKHSDTNIVDLRPALKKNKSNYLLYKKNDTHWNAMGAFVGYSEIASILKEDSIITEELSIDDYDIVTERGGGDLANMLSMNDIIEANYLTLKPKIATTVKKVEIDASPYPNPSRLVVNENTSSTSGLKLLMFRDSFSSDLIPFLSEHFLKSVYVWDQYFDADLIEKEDPDVVIFEVVERNLETLLVENPNGVY